MLSLVSSPAQAAEWWVADEADVPALSEALAALWPDEPHVISVGADWHQEIELLWLAGHVNRFERGDLRARSAVSLGHSSDGGMASIRAECGLSHLLGYATALRSQTRGRGQFVMEFDRFDVL